MKVIVAGPRQYDNSEYISQKIEETPIQITELVCGMAKGVDTCAYNWAKAKGIPIKEFPAQWKTFGNSAGPIRNRFMANYADALIAFWAMPDGTMGTIDMLMKARDVNIPYYIHKVECPKCHQVVRG